MPTPSSNTGRDPRQTSTESYGQGQSGYASGRVEADPSLPLQGRNLAPAIPEHARLPFADDEPTQEVPATDDRFTGAGSVPWAPEDRIDGDPADTQDDE